MLCYREQLDNDSGGYHQHDPEVKEGNEDDWKTVVEKGKEEERNEDSLVIRDYFMLVN